jgi:hypothetical protein
MAYIISEFGRTSLDCSFQAPGSRHDDLEVRGVDIFFFR